MSSPSLSVIVLAYNTRALVLSCLNAFSVAAQEQGWQLLVVDNGSSDGTAAAVAAAYPQAQVVAGQTNLGFAGGNNLGLSQATGKAVILLNSDVVAAPEVLGRLGAYLQVHPDVGAVSPGLRTATGAPQAFAFGNDPTLAYLLKRGLRALLRLGPQHDWAIAQESDVEWVSGACLCVRQEVIEQVGLLDSGFFLYFEDNDWCLRMRQAGWRVVYDPTVQVVHLGGASQPRRQIASDLYYRSMLYFYAKHYGRLRTALLRGAIAGYRLLLQLRAGALV